MDVEYDASDTYRDDHYRIDGERYPSLPTGGVREEDGHERQHADHHPNGMPGWK